MRFFFIFIFFFLLINHSYFRLPLYKGEAIKEVSPNINPLTGEDPCEDSSKRIQKDSFLDNFISTCSERIEIHSKDWKLTRVIRINFSNITSELQEKKRLIAIAGYSPNSNQTNLSFYDLKTMGLRNETLVLGAGYWKLLGLLRENTYLIQNKRELKIFLSELQAYRDLIQFPTDMEFCVYNSTEIVVACKERNTVWIYTLKTDNQQLGRPISLNAEIQDLVVMNSFLAITMMDKKALFISLTTFEIVEKKELKSTLEKYLEKSFKIAKIERSSDYLIYKHNQTTILNKDLAISSNSIYSFQIVGIITLKDSEYFNSLKFNETANLILKQGSKVLVDKNDNLDTDSQLLVNGKGSIFELNERIFGITLSVNPEIKNEFALFDLKELKVVNKFKLENHSSISAFDVHSTFLFLYSGNQLDIFSICETHLTNINKSLAFDLTETSKPPSNIALAGYLSPKNNYLAAIIASEEGVSIYNITSNFSNYSANIPTRFYENGIDLLVNELNGHLISWILTEKSVIILSWSNNYDRLIGRLDFNSTITSHQLENDTLIVTIGKNSVFYLLKLECRGSDFSVNISYRILPRWRDFSGLIKFNLKQNCLLTGETVYYFNEAETCQAGKVTLHDLCVDKCRNGYDFLYHKCSSNPIVEDVIRPDGNDGGGKIILFVILAFLICLIAIFARILIKKKRFRQDQPDERQTGNFPHNITINPEFSSIKTTNGQVI